MPAYLVARVEITDPIAYAEYMKHTPRVIAAHGGRFLARGMAAAHLEGPQDGRRAVLIEFPDVAAARRFYGSPEYRAVMALRANAGAMQSIVMEGLVPEAWDVLVADSRAVPAP